MLKVKINSVKNLTAPEKFFVEKVLELLSPDTIDTYRLRLHNPKTLIKELSSVIQSIKSNTLKEEYGKVLCNELLNILKDEKELQFNSISKEYLLSRLPKHELENIGYAINMIYKENVDYTNVLFEAISNEITRLNLLAKTNYEDYNNLNRLIQYFIIDLHRFGYNKLYLKNFITAIFGGNKKLPDFVAQFSAIKTLINRPPENFTIYFGFHLKSYGLQLLKQHDFGFAICDKSELEKQALEIKSFDRFLEENSNLVFLKCTKKAQDYYAAGAAARKEVQKMMDFLFIGADEDIFNLNNSCFVIGENNPKKSKSQSLAYKLDGHFKASEQSFEVFMDKFKQIDKHLVTEITLNKLNSTLRYLRYGLLANEQEHKLLNYWIAIEYLFATPEKNANKTDRMRKFFSKIHSISYARRQFVDLHHSIMHLMLEKKFTNYDINNLNYLLEPQNEIVVSSFKDRYPLLYYRYHTIVNKYKTTKSINEDLGRHIHNIEWNITRIYRTRNEIVHGAATDLDILDLAGHLKYYLAFTINALLNFILDSPKDLNNDDEITMEDFFILNNIKYDALIENKSLSINELLAMPNPVEYLQN